MADQQEEPIRRMAPVKLTASEVATKIRELIQANKDYDDVELEKKRITRDHTARMKDLRARTQKLTKEIDEESENRSVDCERRANLEARLWEVIRLDTGEVIETDTMSGEDVKNERQLRFGGH